jgi:hypothetical protein
MSIIQGLWIEDPAERPLKQEVWASVLDGHWQALRTSMKGLPTYSKIHLCRTWLEEREAGGVDRVARVCVHNYIGALKRGGQLSADGEILK